MGDMLLAQSAVHVASGALFFFLPGNPPPSFEQPAYQGRGLSSDAMDKTNSGLDPIGECILAPRHVGIWTTGKCWYSCECVTQHLLASALERLIYCALRTVTVLGDTVKLHKTGQGLLDAANPTVPSSGTGSHVKCPCFICYKPLHRHSG